MPRPLPQRALARRALSETPSAKRGWVQHGVAALGVTVLGLGVAGSVALTGNAEHLPATSAPPAAAVAQPSVSASVAAGVKVPTAFTRREAAVSRSSFRPALGVAAVDRRADQRAESLATASRQTSRSAQRKALQTREKSLAAAASSAKKKAKQIKAKEEREAKEAKEAKRRAQAERQSNKASLPVTSGYRIAARFGDTGSWSRYHTGIDFSAGMGTPVHAIAAGEVTHAGSGSAGWAGHYVTIRHADGKSTLYAHMSTVSVHVGERVSGGQKVGAIGMTGRTFGPHVHVELYPAGVKPGDPYKAINPAPWMSDRGVRP